MVSSIVNTYCSVADVLAANRKTPVCEGSKLKDSSRDWEHQRRGMILGDSDLLHIDRSFGRGLRGFFLILI